MDYDPELPAGFQDADLEQAAFEAESARYAAMRRRGICTHSSGRGDSTGSLYRCHDCQGVFARHGASDYPEPGQAPDIPADDPRALALTLADESRDVDRWFAVADSVRRTL